MKREYNFSKRKRGPVVPPEPGQVRRRSEKLERATGVEPATSSLGRAPTRESRGNPRMQILELQGFSNFRIPASDPDFDRSPGNFDRNLPETDVQLRGSVDINAKVTPGAPPSCKVGAKRDFISVRHRARSAPTRSASR